MSTTTFSTTRDVWTRALDRAIAAGLDILIEPVSGEAFCESASRPGTLYAVTASSCTCAAGQHGRPCKHVAAYRAQAGLLPLPPDDSQPAVAVTRHCATCGHRVAGFAAFCSEACAELGPLHGSAGPIQLVTIAA
jgi:hypothetical protein